MLRLRTRVLVAAPVLIGLAFLVGLAASPSIAQAATHRRVAVLRVDIQGGLAPNNEDFLRRSLMESLANADFQVFGGLAVNQLLKQGSRLENCREASCYQEIARSLGVEYLVNGSITVDRKNYDVALELISGRDGRMIDKYNEPCQLCGIKEVGTKLDQLVQAVRRGAEGAAATAPARYAVESRPAGAEVLVDGRSAGVTPISVDLSAGPHKLTVRAGGYDISERSVSVESGSNGVVAVDLAPTGGGGGGGGRGPSRVLAWTTMALGVVAIGVGFVALHYNGQFLECVEPAGAPQGKECIREKVRPTELESGILFGSGGMLLLGGATMLYFSPSDTSSAPGQSASLTHGWTAGLKGTF
jgi:TolB-like protein